MSSPGSVASSASTKNKVLEAAEALYGAEGVEGLSLRTIAERGNVNLAAVNYYFRTKASLTEAMLLRALGPLYDERQALLARLESEYRDSLRPTHVLAAIVLPLIRELTDPETTPFRRQLLWRLTTDQSPVIRNFMIQHFQPRAEQFEIAFIRCMPQLAPAEVLLRAKLLCHALPGSISNYNTVVICDALLQRSGVNCKDILVHLASVLESSLSALFGTLDVAGWVDEALRALADTNTLRALSPRLAAR